MTGILGALEALGEGELKQVELAAQGMRQSLQAERIREEKRRRREERDASAGEGGRWLEWERTNCGKCPRCKTGAYVHGPYWYEYIYSGGRMTSRYIGKYLKEEAAARTGHEQWAGMTPEEVFPEAAEVPIVALPEEAVPAVSAPAAAAGSAEAPAAEKV